MSGMTFKSVTGARVPSLVSVETAGKRNKDVRRNEYVDINRPIFFIGMPRSGTTVIFEAFAAHEEVGWLSNYSFRVPWWPYVTILHRLFGRARGKKNQTEKLPIYKRALPEPAEMYNVWERFFGKQFGDSFLQNYIPKMPEISKCREYVRKALWAQGKQRFCAKFTGPPRISFLLKVFPDACFVDVVRDPRAVVHSLLKVDWWKKRGLEKPFWSGALNEEQLDVWKRYESSPIALAALEWCAVYERTLYEVSCESVSYRRVRYEDFLASPMDVAVDISSFCAVSGSEGLQEYISRQKYRDMNYKFKTGLPDEQVRTIEAITGRYMTELGYK